MKCKNVQRNQREHGRRQLLIMCMVFERKIYRRLVCFAVRRRSIISCVLVARVFCFVYLFARTASAIVACASYIFAHVSAALYMRVWHNVRRTLCKFYKYVGIRFNGWVGLHACVQGNFPKIMQIIPAIHWSFLFSCLSFWSKFEYQ